MESIASALLSLAHQLFQPGFCPGDWAWATSMAGALIALLPIVGAVVIAVMRRFTGNRYHGGPLFTLLVVSVGMVLVLPWLLTSGVSSVFQTVAAGGAGDLSSDQVSALHQEYCFVGSQAEYLGGEQTVYETLFYPTSNKLEYGYYLGVLAGLPFLTLLAIMLLGRIALRRGPKWPGRLIWVSFLAYVVATVGVEANTAAHLWAGFLPVTILGVLPVALIGPPSWSTVQNSDRPPQPEQQAPPAPPPASAHQPPAAGKQYAPTSVAPAQDRPDHSSRAAGAGAVPLLAGNPSGGEPEGSRFRRIRKLGQGGFGTVWKATDTQLDRTVALKIAHVPDEDTAQRMRREGRALAALSHPNCVRVYDLVEEPDGLALVMEYLQGQSLIETVETAGPLDDVAVGRLWATMANALSAAHEENVLHRDVKPSNIILDPSGVPHLIDFGIARSEGDSTLTATGMMVGTPDYVAPETAAGSPASPASDAWQLAATVSFVLSGHPPRGTRETPMAALMAAARAEPPDQLPQQSVHGRLLGACLDPQPRQRPTLRAVAQEVEGWLARTGTSAEGPVTRVMPNR